MAGNSELTLREKQLIILEIMKDIDRFCRANNIPYTLSSGTLLGAVRHGGFIPWDDDADMFMLREDFDRFVREYRSDRYHLLFNSRGRDEFFATGFIKVSDPSTLATDSSSDISHGIFVDIFPLDYVPKEEKERKKRMHRIMRIVNRLYHRQKHDLLSILKAHRHSLDWWWNRLDREVHAPAFLGSSTVAHAVGSKNYRTVLDKNVFSSLKDIRFEDHDFLGLADTDAYLRMVYGADYMTPRQWNHDYKAYKKEEPEEKK